MFITLQITFLRNQRIMVDAFSSSFFQENQNVDSMGSSEHVFVLIFGSVAQFYPWKFTATNDHRSPKTHCEQTSPMSVVVFNAMCYNNLVVWNIHLLLGCRYKYT